MTELTDTRAPVPTKHRPLSKTQREFVALVHDGVRPVMAAKMVGRCERTATRILKRPDVQKMLDEMARSTLALAKGPAANKLVGLMESPSQRVSFEAARHVLSCGGIQPPQGPGTRVNIGIGVFPSRGVITADMNPEEVESIRGEWRNYSGPGRLVNWQHDGPGSEHAPSGGSDA